MAGRRDLWGYRLNCDTFARRVALQDPGLCAAPFLANKRMLELCQPPKELNATIRHGSQKVELALGAALGRLL
jgi:hypothetical protein